MWVCCRDLYSLKKQVITNREIDIKIGVQIVTASEVLAEDRKPLCKDASLTEATQGSHG